MLAEFMIHRNALKIDLPYLNEILERLISEPPLEMSSRTKEAYINELIDIIGSSQVDKISDNLAIILSNLNQYGWTIFVKNPDGTLDATNLI